MSMRITRSQTRRLESIEQQKLEANKAEKAKQLQGNKTQKRDAVKQPQKTKAERTTTQRQSIKRKVEAKSKKQPSKKKVVKVKRKGGKNDEKQTAKEKREETIYGGSSILSSDTESEHESESGDGDDLDSLLNKAVAALRVGQQDTSIPKKQGPIRKLPRMNPDMNQSLYFKTIDGQSKLVEAAVQLVEDGQKPSPNALLVVKANNILSKRPSRKERREERAKSSGKDWFDMPKPEITPEVKRDLQILKMRHILDRKRHYKKMGKQENPTYFQMGTVIEGPTEFFSARLTKKERKQTIVDELLANEEQKQYYKRKHNEVSAKGNSGGKRDYKKLKAHRKPTY